ncbi:MAG: hypothetical protein JST70_18675 [Bacteroidetes bacterium]|nr:hypothetical protein [Bacteroidota bacterium]
MENTTKKYGKALSFLPLISYLLWTVYYTIVASKSNGPSISFDHMNVMSNMMHNYTGLFITLALASILTATILIYFIVHIARLKDMMPEYKIGWIVFMTFAAPIAFIVFWYTELKNEPSEINVYPDIA